MDSIPDHTLQAVFRYLSPVDLMNAVQLVCKRWRKLARSKEAWRDAVVQFSGENEDTVAQVVRLAPALRSLVLKDLTEDHQVLIDSLLHGSLDLREADLVYSKDVNPSVILKLLIRLKDTVVKLKTRVYPWWFCEGWSENGMGAFDIISSMPHLKSLDVNLSECRDADFSRYGENCSRYREQLAHIESLGVNLSECSEADFIEYLSQLPLLESLGVNLSEDRRPDLRKYRGQLGLGCGALEQFTYHGPMGYCNEDYREDVVLWDVLRVHGSKLTHLGLPGAWKYSYFSDYVLTIRDQVQEALKACVNLRCICLPARCVCLVRDLSKLESLKLIFTLHVSEVQATVADFIWSSPVMAALRMLSMEFCDPFVLEGKYILSAVSDTCKELRVLELRFVDWDGNLLTLLKLLHPALSKLEVLCLRGWTGAPTAEHLEFIANLPRLKVFKFCTRSKQTTCSEAVVEVMRALCPSVVVMGVDYFSDAVEL